MVQSAGGLAEAGLSIDINRGDWACHPHVQYLQPYSVIALGPSLLPLPQAFVQNHFYIKFSPHLRGHLQKYNG